MSDPIRAVFLSYRREESRHLAGRVADRLTARFDRLKVFMDVDAITPGDDFGEALARAVASCDVLIAVIGPRWLLIKDSRGLRRLDNPNDWVRTEIREALLRHVRVIPVLADGAAMPTDADLPSDLAALARRNAVRIDHETFSTDVDRLLDAIERPFGMQPRIAEHRRPEPPPFLARQKPPEDDETTTSSTRGVPFHRSALLIALWSASFAATVVCSIFFGVALSGRLQPIAASVTVAAIFFGGPAGLMWLTRKEIIAQRSIVVRIAKGDSDALNKLSSLSSKRVRFMYVSIGLVGLACTLLFALIR